MKTAVVTGASRGLGAAIAEALAAEGYNVIGTSTSGQPTDSVTEMVQLDLSDAGSIKKVAETICDLAPDGVDLLYNNAGFIGKKGSLVDNPDDLVKVMQINTTGQMEFTAYMLDHMNENSLIINMSSGAGDEGSLDGFNYGAYNVSKSAIDFYTKSLARMIADRGIKVIATDPEWVATDMGGMGAPKKPVEVAMEAVELINNYDSLQSGGKYLRAKLKN